MKYRRMRWGLAVMVTALLAACGSDDNNGTVEPPVVPPTDVVIPASIQAQIDASSPESCVVCHNGDFAANGDSHQAAYDEYYQDGVIKIVQGSMALDVVGTTSTLSFKMTMNDSPFDCTLADSLGSYWAGYDVATKTFPSDLSLSSGATKAYDGGTNACTLTKTVTVDQAIALGGVGIVQVYGVDEILYKNAAKHISSGRYPFAGVLKIGAVDYTTAANVSGCENCHTVPYLKHTYIYGTVADNTTGDPTQFYTCKGCHYDERNGGHIDWQILKDDPARYAAIQAGSAITPEETAKYAYKANVMNDVHMSHAMEFAYPQSMKNCVTCHAGKLETVLADSNFKAETCISCHSVDGIQAKMTAAAFSHGGIALTADCTSCHGTGAGPTFSAIHGGGYDPLIYATDGTRFSDAIVVTIDSATVANNQVTLNFSAEEVEALADYGVADMKPLVLMSLYGYDTKDFLVSGHGRDANGKRLLEYVWGDGNPRFTPVLAADGSWEVVVDLSMWADQIASGAIKRAEIAVLPTIGHKTITYVAHGGAVVPAPLGLNAPSMTLTLATSALSNSAGIVDATKCNTCHDQLATTFHSGDRGGNVTVCRMCHTVENGGSHLELQSRSIDSYVHAIHSFQAFDPGDINFDDPVEAMEFQHHINSEFPRFGILDCESCHNPGTYNVPDQAKSMPSLLSGTDDVDNGRTIGTYPRYVVGPATRACGSCHRSEMLNADDGQGDAGGLVALMAHWKSFGYMIEQPADVSGVWDALVAKVMGIF